MPEPRITIEALVMGGHKVIVTGTDEKDAIKNISLFSQLPDACPVCGSALYFTYRKVAAKGDKKGGTFYGIKCKGTPAHEKYFHVHDNEAQNLYMIASEGFEVEYNARGAQESGQPPRQQQTRDDFNAREPDNRAAAQGQQQSGQQQSNGGPTASQRTIIEKLLKDAGMTLAEAYGVVGPTKKLEDMNVGEAARFISALKLETGVK